MAKVKVFVHAANADADGRAMALAPRTFIPARKKEMEPDVWKGKLSLLTSHTRCKYSLETTHNSVKVKLGIKVI